METVVSFELSSLLQLRHVYIMCIFYIYIIYLSFCFSFALGPEYQEKLRLGEELKAIEETLKFKKRQIKELQQDLQVSPGYCLNSVPISSEY